MKMPRARSALIAAGAAALLLTTALPAQAATVSPPIIDDLSAPLGLAVGSDGTIYVSQNDFFGGGPASLSQYRKGTLTPIASGGFITGVAAEGRGTTTFLADGSVKVINPSGKPRTLADLAAFEAAANPDQVNTYGLQGLSDTCRTALEGADLPEQVLGALLPHQGVVDSNPYAVAIMPNGERIVADAGGNTLLRVKPSGAVSVLAVLPARPATVTADVVSEFGLPECTLGLTVNFDFVPTDVERGPGGVLVVSSLPGGPEGPSAFGPRGGVFTVNPASGALTQLATGFAGATDLAVTPGGAVYVTELFAGRVSMVSGGAPVLVASIDEPVAIEYADGKLFVAAGVFGGPGKVVTITP